MSVLKTIRASKYKELEPYIIAQSKHETAFKGKAWNSPLFLRGNNLFGMKVARRRKQLGFTGSLSPEGDKYRFYNSHAESVKDFLMYLDFVKFPTKVESAEQYVSELFNRGYFTDSYNNYLRGVKFWLSK